MAPATKANYKSYEAQARMIRAMVAAHPEVKWNYKEIIRCYGSDMTKDALAHRVRTWKIEALIIREGLKRDLDMKYLESDEKKLPKTQESVDKQNIAKYFGQSTGDGIQFQFRAVKKDADLLRRTVAAGENASSCLSLGGSVSSSAPVTPSKSKPTPSRNAASRSGSGAKRSRAVSLKVESSGDEDVPDGSESEDWGDKDETPSKRPRTSGAAPGQKNGTPSRQAAARAAVTIADATAQLDSSESPEEVDTPINSAPVPLSLPVRETAAPSSIFGNPEPKQPSFHQPMAEEPEVFHDAAFGGHDMDPYFGAGGDGSQYSGTRFMSDADGDDFDGEI